MSMITSIITMFGGLTTGFEIIFLALLWLMAKVNSSFFSAKSTASRSTIENERV
jgi:hypothetical protein